MKKNEVEKTQEGISKKQQIITLVIGILIGAVITSAIFLIAKPKNTRGVPNFSKFEENGERVRPSDGSFDFSKEGRSRKNRDGSSDDTKKVDDNSKTEDTTNEKQD